MSVTVYRSRFNCICSIVID